MSSLRLLISNSHDPWFNLAVEESIFKQMPATQKVLFLWQNADTVVIGRAQNPWKECNTGKMADDGIKLARRSSGGGAVFHDLGNSCFTFMAGKPEYDKTISTQIILNALHSLGLDVVASGRNDLVIPTADGDRKISGSAYKETPNRGFHHGTLLLDSNLSRLADYLNPDPKKLQAKGITSVRSRVTNIKQFLTEINHDIICQAIIDAFFIYYNERVEAEIISPQSLPNLPGFSEIYARQSSWEWNFGKAPAFTHTLDERFNWGGVEIHFNIENGYLTDVRLFTDSLNPGPLEQLAHQLVGTKYDSQNMQQKCKLLIETYPEQQTELNDMAAWLAQTVR